MLVNLRFHCTDKISTRVKRLFLLFEAIIEFAAALCEGGAENCAHSSSTCRYKKTTHQYVCM